MTDRGINAGMISWRTHYEGILGYLTIFTKYIFMSKGRRKGFSTGKTGEVRISVPLKDV